MRASERVRFERLLKRHHYLGCGQPVGETMRYVAEARGRWLALLQKQGGRVETRQLQVLDVSAEQMGFPFAKQLLLLRRHRLYLDDGHEEEGFLHLLCSHPSSRCSAADLLRLCRGHWIIESSIHYCRDVLYSEDRCRIRDTSAARVLATLHSLAVFMFGKNRRTRRDTRRRKHKRINRHPGIAVRMITRTP